MDSNTRATISKNIRALPPYHQLAFGVMLTERFLPNYFAFHLIEQWGNPMVLLNGIDLLKDIVAQKQHDSEEVQIIDELIEDVTPDMDDFGGNTLASLALDVSSMLYECFSFVRTQDPKHIETTSAIAFDSLSLYVQKRDKYPHDLSLESLEARLGQEPLILREVEFQVSLLQDLAKQAKINHALYISQALAAPNLKFREMARMG
ncbi:MAG: DUF416 family protein [Saprospiraceae bacterium]|jgi:uncharacterized protein YjaG (DUF416 family)|nr:DUF416 family protein [Saprospiraceae bacterium]